MKKLLLGLALLLLSGCALPNYVVRDEYPYQMRLCFINTYSYTLDCGWYDYATYRYYQRYLTYNRYNGVHFFSHYNWYNPRGYIVTQPKERHGVVTPKGYKRTQYKESSRETRTAQPRRRTIAPPKVQAPRSSPPPKVRPSTQRKAKRRGGG